MPEDSDYCDAAEDGAGAVGARAEAMSRRWKLIWLLGIAFHTFATPSMYRVWWFFGYRWVYPYMSKAKSEGKDFAQCYGEGSIAVLKVLLDGRC